MAKKTESAVKATTTPGKPAARKPAVKPLSSAAAEALETPVAPARAPLKDGASSRSKPAPKAASKPAPKASVSKTPVHPSFTTEDIALRAYFIAENRQRHGLHGDEHSDWVEAERQLRTELKKAAKSTASRKPAPAKKSR